MDEERPSQKRDASTKFREQALAELRAADMPLRPEGYHVAAREAHLATELALKSPRTDDPVAMRFARVMRDRHGADLYLFGSRARARHRPDSDYDFAAVASSFAGQSDLYRALDRFRLWNEAGGGEIALYLHCYTPEEFASELDGLGYLAEANEPGELLKVPTDLKGAA